MQAPKDILENKKFRLRLLDRAEKDEEFKLLIKKKCALDKVFFIDTFCWTYDPRLTDPVIPFILYPKQEELIKWLDLLLYRSRNGEKVNALIDKPRAVGATYTFMCWALAEYLFGDSSIRVGSRKEEYVDKKGEADTLFYKLDFNLERLPSWILPSKYHPALSRASMILKNPDNTNAISGESANPNFGRGGRKSCIMFDEMAFWSWAKSSWESSGESTNMRVAMSTPPESGRDSYFYKLRTGKQGRVEVFNFDWRDVPYRDDKWLQEQKETKSDEELAREVFKSYESTTRGKVYARDLQLSAFNNCDYDPHLPLFISWDFGLDGVAMIWWQKNFLTNKVRLIDSYENADLALDFYLPFVFGKIESGAHHYEEWELEKIKLHSIWTKTITHFGDPDVKKRAVKDGESTRDWLQKKNIYVQSRDWSSRGWMDHREKTKLLFRRLEINEARCETLISALRNAKYPERRENSQSTSEISLPVHDWTSHFRTSFEYFADNEPEAFISLEEEKALIREEEAQQRDYNKYDLF